MDSKLVWPKSCLSLLSRGGSMIIVLLRWIYLVTVYHTGISVFGKFVIWLSKLLLSMSVWAVFAEFALALLDPELALLGLVIVVLYIHHFQDELSWEWLNKLCQNHKKRIIGLFWSTTNKSWTKHLQHFYPSSQLGREQNGSYCFWHIGQSFHSACKAKFCKRWWDLAATFGQWYWQNLEYLVSSNRVSLRGQVPHSCCPLNLGVQGHWCCYLDLLGFHCSGSYLAATTMISRHRNQVRSHHTQVSTLSL